MLQSMTALLVRSLREDSRSFHAHLYRLLLAFGTLLCLVYAHYTSSVKGAPGFEFFSTICWLNFAFITVGGVSLFATPITEEKEEATLGLLRMAGINPLGLLLGKSTSRLWVAVMILAVQFPFTLLAITLGGVLWHQIITAYLALLAWLVLAANIGLVTSVICARSSGASFLSSIVIGTFLVGPYLVWQVSNSLARTGSLGLTVAWHMLSELCLGLQQVNIFHALTEVLQTGFNGDSFAPQVWSNLIGGAALFGLSLALFDISTRNHLISAPPRAPLTLWRSGSRLNLFSAGRAWTPLPLAWKEFQFMTGGLTLLLVRFVLYGCLILGVTAFMELVNRRNFGSRGLLPHFGEAAIPTMLFVGGLEMAVYASRIFREELRAQTLPTLMLLPSTVGTLILSKLLGSLLALGPALFWLFLGMVLESEDVFHFFRSILRRESMVLVFFALNYLTFLHLVAFLSLVLKWGAFPLSFALSYPVTWTVLISCLSVMRVSSATGQLVFAVINLGHLMIIAALVAGIWFQVKAHGEQG